MTASRTLSRLLAHVSAIRALLASTAPPLPSRELLRADLLRHGSRGPALHRACAWVHRACIDTLGLAPFDTQWLAALAMLEGRLAEMATGEGKTIAIGLAAAVLALAGRRVHVLSANDYLVERDSHALLPLFERLQLQVGCVLARHNARQRAAAHARPIVYVTARELVFDCLRDAQAAGPDPLPLRRHAGALLGQAQASRLVGALDVALIDEADSILLDEAQTPLILSRPMDEADESQRLREALHAARDLQAGLHFDTPCTLPRARLTPEGRSLVTKPLAGPTRWLHPVQRTEYVERALAALHALRRDHDYLVREGQVLLIDDLTGRPAPGRQWSQGVHALVALKEGVPPPARLEPVSQLIYPRFFPRYRHLAGMSGTLYESRAELWRLYRLPVMPVPTRLPSRRHVMPGRLFTSAGERRDAVVRRAQELAAAGRPVLIGTDSVDESRALAQLFEHGGCDVAVLNAAQDLHEARIVAEAGRPGRITVATRMAGRGTDIRLAPQAARAGGLHVLNCQDSKSRRHDRQLAGRCARQGDPGSVEHWRLCSSIAFPWWSALVLRCRQAATERLAAQERRRLIEMDRLDQTRLRFALPAE